MIGSNEKENTSTDVYQTSTLTTILDPDKNQIKDTIEREDSHCRFSSRLGMYYRAVILKIINQ